MRLDINDELEKIIEKYNLDRHYPAYKESRRACDYIYKWIKALSHTGKKSLFIGMDEHALKLINNWGADSKISTLLVCSVEKLKSFTGILENADKLYIVSYTRTIELLHWLWEHGYQAESIYDILENEGIYLQMEFYRFFSPLQMSPELNLNENLEEKSIDGSSLVLYEFYYQKQRLLHSVCMKEQKRLKEKLFFLSLCMKNFLEAENILNTMFEADEFKRCWNEIQQLFSQVREILFLKKEKDIIIYWIDAMSYEESKKLEYLESRRTHSLYFHNAYAETPYTNAVCRSMFCELRQVDDLGYKIKNIDSQNSSLLRDIARQGYEFRIIGDYLSKLFETKFNQCADICKKSSCSEMLWNLLDQMLRSNRKTVYLVHILEELHSPYLSVRRERFEIPYTRISRKEQIKEVDVQLRFYDEMLGDRPYRIYMSDHGSWNDVRRKIHIHFQVFHSSWDERETEKMFCFLDFSKIMHLLLLGKEINTELICNREYVPIQDVDHYNKEDLKNVLKGIGHLLSFISYKGAVTKEGIYMYFKTGDELYHRWSEEISDVQMYLDGTKEETEFYKKMRRKIGNFPKELDTEPRFQYAVYTYKAYENVKRTVRGIAGLINKKFSDYADGSIALRMGGEHSWQVYGLLTESNRKKVGAIIDRDDQCMCRRLNAEFFLPGEKLPDSIKTVLLSSYIYLDELKSEAEEFYGGVEIMDVYQYWKENGYDFQSREFWFGLDSDYEVGFPED